MHRDIAGGLDTKANFVASDINNGDFNVVTDHDCFVALSRKDKHGESFPKGDVG
jgi:hypothetical protein